MIRQPNRSCSLVLLRCVILVTSGLTNHEDLCTSIAFGACQNKNHMVRSILPPRKLSFIIPLFLMVVTACDKPVHTSNEEKGQLCHETEVEWSYDGSNKPSQWADLSPDFVACAEGGLQSPIDFESHKVSQHSDGILRFDYKKVAIDVLDNGHTIQANCDSGNILKVGEEIYKLRQFHFHSPSEHQIDGIIYPMELHLVHTNELNDVAVLGFFIKEGEQNEVLDVFIESIPNAVSEHVRPPEEFDFSHLVPANHMAYHYTGSLTTPPCTEGVNWIVLTTPLEMSKAQIAAFKSHYDHINRPIQKMGSRVVEICD